LGAESYGSATVNLTSGSYPLYGRTPRRGMLKPRTQQVNVAAALSLPHVLSRRGAASTADGGRYLGPPRFLAPGSREQPGGNDIGISGSYTPAGRERSQCGPDPSVFAG